MTGTLIGGVDTPNVFTFRLNPTDQTTFPWLSPIAKNFQQWRPHGIVFELVSASGAAVASTNAALGTFSIGTQYDVNAEAFSTKRVLLNSHFATSARVSDDQMHPVECRREDIVGNLLFTDPELVDPQWEPRLDDLGITTIWASGSQASYVAAQLWVTYEIELIKPKMQPAPAGGISAIDQYYADHPEERPRARHPAAAGPAAEDDPPPMPLPTLERSPASPAPSTEPGDEGVVVAPPDLSASGYAGFVLGARSAARNIPKRL